MGGVAKFVYVPESPDKVLGTDILSRPPLSINDQASDLLHDAKRDLDSGSLVRAGEKLKEAGWIIDDICKKGKIKAGFFGSSRSVEEWKKRKDQWRDVQKVVDEYSKKQDLNVSSLREYREGGEVGQLYTDIDDLCGRIEILFSNPYEQQEDEIAALISSVTKVGERTYNPKICKGLIRDLREWGNKRWGRVSRDRLSNSEAAACYYAHMLKGVSTKEDVEKLGVAFELTPADITEDFINYILELATKNKAPNDNGLVKALKAIGFEGDVSLLEQKLRTFQEPADPGNRLT